MEIQNMNQNDVNINEESADSAGDPRVNLVKEDQSKDNSGDESQIISDQDMTTEGDIMNLDENMGAKTNSLNSLEDEPADFITGEIDVKEQMDRTTREMDYAINRSTGRRSHPKQDLPKQRRKSLRQG